MTQAELQAIAEAVTERLLGALDEGRGQGESWLTADEMGRRYEVTGGWFRERAEAFGGVRLGEGPRAPIRFSPSRVADTIASWSADRRSPAPEVPARRALSPRRRNAPSGTTKDLLPIRGRSELSSLDKQAAGRRANVPGPAPEDRTPARREAIATDRPRATAGAPSARTRDGEREDRGHGG